MTSSLLSSALLALLLLGCGPGDETPEAGGAAPGTTADGAAPTPPAPASGEEASAPADGEEDGAGTGPSVRGRFSYVRPGSKAKRSLSQGALVEAILQHKTADGGWEEISRHHYYSMGRQVPLGFTIPYDPASIDAEGDYQVIVRISEGMYTIFQSAEGTPVLTKGHPTGEVRDDLMLYLDPVEK